MENKIQELFSGDIKVINVGLRKFAGELDAQDLEVVQIDWTPPAGGDQELIDLLDDLL